MKARLNNAEVLSARRLTSGGAWSQQQADTVRCLLQKALLEIENLRESRDSFETKYALEAGENERLRALLNSPQTANFLEAVRTEAAHQIERWGTDHDAGKGDGDWFWLLGYLAGKAIRPDATPEKKLHHIITTAAACLNWHRHATGENTEMRPGIATPEEA